MRSQRSVLALRYTPVSVVGGVRRAVGGFLRYVQYRDQHLESNEVSGVDAYVRYMAHRDRTSPAARIFGREGTCTSADRRRFVDFVARSTRGLQPKWAISRDGKRVDRQRAVYSFILSPEDWRGLDLRSLTQGAMHQLEQDAGPEGIGPWFAAEHRNTAHHHVHIVLAARRETALGRFSTLLVTRARLQRMKDAIAIEITRQRAREAGPRAERNDQATYPSTVASAKLERRERSTARLRWLTQRPRSPRRRRAAMRSPHRTAHWTHSALQAIARRYSERMQWDLERETTRAEREGWVR